DPIYLVTLAAIPLVALAYLLTRRRRRRFALRFPAAASLQGIKQPRWRRILPAALLAGAAALLSIAVAKPQARMAIPVAKASVMLITDESGSMLADDVDPSRLAAAQSAAEKFLDRVPDSLLVGLVGYSTGVNTTVEPTEDHGEVKTALEGLQADGGTATGDAL